MIQPQIVVAVSMQGKRPKISVKISEKWKTLILNCLEQDPKKRPTLEKIMEEIDQIDTKEPKQSVPYKRLGAEYSPSYPPLKIRNPLQTLQNILLPLSDKISLLENYYFLANSRFKGDIKYNLSIDEATAIFLYTIQWPTREDSLYFRLNSALRTEDQDMIKPFLPYMYLLCRGLEKLPKFTGTIWRVVPEDLSHLKKDDTIAWVAFASCTTNGDFAKSYIEKFPSNTLFNISCKSGISVRDFSQYPSEEEILLLPLLLKVKNKISASQSLCIIELEDMDYPLVLLKI